MIGILRSSKYDKLQLDYRDFGELCYVLYENIKRDKAYKKYEFTHVYGPPVGGLSIAAFMSHHLNLEYITELNKKSTQQCKNLLFVDNVNHTGNTILQTEKILNSISTYNCKMLVACLHKRPKTNFEHCIYAAEIPDDIWIVYPWEVDEEPSDNYKAHLEQHYKS